MTFEPYIEPVLGLDLSLNGTGWAVSTPGLNGTFAVETGTFETPKNLRAGREVERLLWLRDKLENLLLRYSLKHRAHAVMEGYAFRGNGGFDIGEWGGVVRTLLAQAGIHQYLVSPNSLKKFVVQGTAKKEQMLLHVYKRWGRTFETNDEADAFALVMAGTESLKNQKVDFAINSLYLAPDAGRIPVARRRVLRISSEN